MVGARACSCALTLEGDRPSGVCSGGLGRGRATTNRGDEWKNRWAGYVGEGCPGLSVGNSQLVKRCVQVVRARRAEGHGRFVDGSGCLDGEKGVSSESSRWAEFVEVRLGAGAPLGGPASRGAGRKCFPCQAELGRIAR